MPEGTKTDEPLTIETITVKVDGNKIDVPKFTQDWQGKTIPTTVLQACKHAGYAIVSYVPFSNHE